MDWVIKKAAEKGIFIGLLPTWGDKWNKKWGAGPEIFTPGNAWIYGKYLGERYKNSPNIIWIVGGDRPVESDIQRQILAEMAKGLREGDGGNHLITFHPTGGSGSAQYFHNEPWLDFNMRQNGHSNSYTERYHMTLNDYNLVPAKRFLTANPFMKTTPLISNPTKTGTRWQPMCAVRFTGICFQALSVIRTAIIRYGKCLRLARIQSTVR